MSKGSKKVRRKRLSPRFMKLSRSKMAQKAVKRIL